MANVVKWEGVMKAVLNMPGIKVDRTKFLQSTFCAYNNSDDLENKRPSEVYNQLIIDKVAKGIVNNHSTKATAISAAAGIPGGFAMLGTIPADLAQYYWHFLVMAQKLAYVYGWPDLRDENNNIGEQGQAILTIFVGVGFGADGAAAATREIAKRAAEHWAKKIPQMALTKTFWYPIVKKIASWLGIKLTKDSVGKAAGKVIPLLGAVVSGTLTYATFKPMANKLRKELAQTALLRSSAS